MARWIRLDSLHVTSLFLGGVPPEQVSGLAASLDGVGAAGSPFGVATGPGSGRTRGRDAVAWLSVRDGASAIDDLSRTLEGVLTPAGDGQPLAPRRMPPHVTVARHATPALIDALASRQLGPIDVAWTATEMVLYRSHPASGGSVYERLHAVQLGGGSTAMPG